MYMYTCKARKPKLPTHHRTPQGLPVSPLAAPQTPTNTTTIYVAPSKSSRGPPGTLGFNLWAPQLPREAPGALPVGPGSGQVVSEDHWCPPRSCLTLPWERSRGRPWELRGFRRPI